MCVPAQALECFQKAHEAAGGSNADYAARIKTLKHKTGSQQKIAKVSCSAVYDCAVQQSSSHITLPAGSVSSCTCAVKQCWHSEHFICAGALLCMSAMMPLQQ
jgi:hypothetical protein